MSEEKFLRLVELERSRGNKQGELEALQGLKRFRINNQTNVGEFESVIEDANRLNDDLSNGLTQQQSSGQNNRLGVLGDIDRSVTQTMRSNPVGRGALQFAASVNRGAADVLDFFTVDQVNAVRSLIGKEPDIPTMRNIVNVIQGGELQGPEVQFMEPGLARNIISSAGEVTPSALTGGLALRSAAAQLPAVTGTTSTTQGVIKQLGSTTPIQDITLGSISGAGAAIGEEVGGETGALVGAILLPATAEGGRLALSRLLSSGARGFQALTKSLQQLSDDEASRLLAEAMIRDGIGPEDVAARLQQLGPDAIPADVSASFSRLLRSAGNIIPRIEGRATTVLDARQAQSGQRIARATDEIISGNVDDQIKKLELTNGPRVKALYDLVRSKSIDISDRLQGLLSGKNALGKARVKAEKRLADRKAAGDDISNIDILDATKQELDDQIGSFMRQGKKNRARDLIRLKNVLVEEADSAIPEYKQARGLFAGQRQLQQAADLGKDYFRLNARDIENLVKNMGKSEREMFRLGAKQAIEDKILDLQTNADQVKRLFGRNGDVIKLKSLFDNQRSFKNFSDALEREANFVLTRRAAQGNSTTAKQLNDISSVRQASDDARSLLLGGNSERLGAIGRILERLTGNKSDESFRLGLEQAGDLLLEANINPDRIRTLLRGGSRKMIEKELLKALDIPENTSTLAPIISATAAQQEDQ